MKLKQKLLYQQHGLPIPKVHVDMKTNTYFLYINTDEWPQKMKEEFHPVYSYFKPYYRDASILRDKIHIKDKVLILKVQLLGCNFI